MQPLAQVRGALHEDMSDMPQDLPMDREHWDPDQFGRHIAMKTKVLKLNSHIPTLTRLHADHPLTSYTVKQYSFDSYKEIASLAGELKQISIVPAGFSKPGFSDFGFSNFFVFSDQKPKVLGRQLCKPQIELSNRSFVRYSPEKNSLHTYALKGEEMVHKIGKNEKISLVTQCMTESEY